DVRNVAAPPEAGGVVTTAADVCAFAHAVWKGGLLSPESVAKISASPEYGWMARERAGQKAFGNDGRVPGFGASLDYFPASDACVAVLTNMNTSVAQAVAPDIA